MINRRIQNYKIISLLGEGGMGSVYKVFDIHLERYAALKILNLNSTSNSAFIERFKREARNQAKLSHPNIVSVYGFVQENEILGIAMEYIEGNTLESIISNRGRIDFGYAVELMVQILNGIQEAHNQGFIHRDLKPSNIILDVQGNPKIMDFGISKSIDELKSITQHNAKPGTLLYMSPEQLSGGLITIKSDLYALGITFYEMLTGVHPYNSSTIYDIIDSHVNSIPPRISSPYNSVPQIADEIILKALGKFSVNNFNDANEFRDALNAIQLSSSNTSVPRQYDEYSNQEPIEVGEIKNSKTFQRIGNILLFIIFFGLAILAFKVVKTYLAEEGDKQQKSNLNNTQNYSVNYFINSGWEEIKIGLSNNLNAISFVNDYVTYIGADSGVLLQSFDGGSNWKKIKTPFNNNIYSINSVDNRTFFVGSSGFVVYTENNSNNFNNLSLNTSESFFKVYFVDYNIGFLVGRNGIIYKTYDGGLSWKKIRSNVKVNLYSISFPDSENGIIIGERGTLLKSNDGGDNWEKSTLNNSSYLKDIDFANEFLGLIVGGSGTVLRTENGGDFWQEISLNTASGLYKVVFDNSGEAYAVSNTGDIYNSNDAGKTWVKNSIGKPVVLNDIKKLNSGNYIVLGNGGNLFKSKLKK